MIEELWLVPLGFAATMLGSMVGLGGGVFVVAALALAGVPPAAAVSQSLFAVTAGAVSSSASYSRLSGIDYKIAVPMGLAAVPGTILGTVLVGYARPDLFYLAFAGFTAACAAYILARSRMADRGPSRRRCLGALAIGACFCAGVISALLGVGSGIIIVPLMILGLGMAMKQAVPTMSVVIIIAAASGMVAHLYMGHPDLADAGLLMAGAFLGGLAGPRIFKKAQEKALRWIISLIMLGTAIALAYGVLGDAAWDVM